MTRKIYPLKNFWTQILNKHFKKQIFRKKTRFSLMPIEQNEVYTEGLNLVCFGCQFKLRGAVTFFLFFRIKKNIFQEKNPTIFLKLPWGKDFSGRNMHNFDFSLCAIFFFISVGLNRHSPSIAH